METKTITPKATSVDRLNKVEEQVENLQGTVNKIDSGMASIMAGIESLKSTPPPTNAVGSEKMFYQTSKMSDVSMSKVVPTNIEQAPEKKLGIFDILTPIIDKVTVSKPHVKKDGSKGKSFILNLPRIDEDFPLVDKTLNKAQRTEQSKSMWKTVAFSGYTFTGKYFDKEAGKSAFTTYIKSQNEETFIKWLTSKGVHIPKKE